MSLLERTLSDIARPTWEASRTFGTVWEGTVACAQNLKIARPWREWGCEVLRGLATARVLVVDPAQAAVLPPLTCARFGEAQDLELFRNAMERVTLPWDSIYMDLGGVLRPDYDNTQECAEIPGALVRRFEDGRLRILGFVDGTPISVVAPGERGVGAWTPALEYGRDEVSAAYARAGKDVAEMEKEMAENAIDRAERVIAALQWLESANVEVVDAPLTRQVRRQAERKGHEISKIVRVKLPKSHRDGRQPMHTGVIDFDHRFEVRGHYKFFPAATKLAKAAPEKLSWVPERNGYFRRIWCPPFVKGPIGKPLVPKTRVLGAV
jgi:hypothetical protein